jgi:hypothetical protein
MAPVSAPAAESLPAAATEMLIVDRALRVLAQLDTQRQRMLSDWAARDTPGRERNDLPPAELAQVLDSLVGQHVDDMHQLLARGLDNSRANIVGYAATPHDSSLRAALGQGLAACLVGTETIGFFTAAARGLYSLVGQGEFNQLTSWFAAFERQAIQPVLDAAGRNLEGSDRQDLADSLTHARAQFDLASAFLTRYAQLVAQWAPVIRNVIRALEALQLAYSCYELGLALMAAGGGPPPAGGLATAGAGRGLMTGVAVLPRIPDWTALLERLVVTGAFAAQIVLMSAAATGGTGSPAFASSGSQQASPASPDPDEDWEATLRGQPSGDPQPAQEGFYPKPTKPNELAQQARRLEAAQQVESQDLANRPWSELPQAIRRRFGYWLMREIYPAMVAINRGGRGLVFTGGVVTPRFINSLRGQTPRVTFIESSLRAGAGRMVRPDAFEVTFAEQAALHDSADVVDLTTSLRPDHLLSTGQGYGGLLRNIGFRVTASDIVIWDGNRWIADLGIFPAPIP